MSDTILCQMSETGVVTLSLQRPEVCNAINEIMVAELTATLAAISQNSSARVLILTGSGDFFCAGTDHQWMLRGSKAGPDHNFEDALHIARLLRTLDRLPIPTIAHINGPAIGTGIGLISCCDMAVCTPNSWFSIPDTRLGLIPAVFGPYVINKIGSSAARRYFLSTEKFNPTTAQRLGLIHECPPSAQEAQNQVDLWVSELIKNSPHALTAAKRFITSVEHRPIDDAMLSDTAHRMAHIRTHEEAQEGLQAYLNQCDPNWLAS
ncbi:enoyl-CoA hydratase/isomerase family protein [Chitinibacter bivalviorum]|uniref:Enoyl-CoA hydratase/isomerase family protein n=1 Tax=Chitinibacter bivalviorum TaxID=2739434 RepID=A0A7H9BG51_9NEIS|nr:enoyl-CoA hydratase-related protein [Chitinibacter bivalviorum]QLG87188.1 enoyl-CoA hydratase/isomerase family protein [Chitinibacter bivalviorum]